MQTPLRSLLLSLIGSFVFLLSLPCAISAAPAYGLHSLPTNRPISIGYLNSPRSASEINSFVWSGFDAVVHAFAEPLDSDGSVGEGLPNFLVNQASLLSAAHAHGKAVILSIGGSNPAEIATQFDNIAGDATKRAHFCQAVVNYLQTHGYDGVDIDWEFPSVPAGKAKMTLLMQDLHAAVKGANPNYIVMFATGPGYWLGSYDFAALASVTDFYFHFGYDWTNTNPNYGIVVPQNGPISNPNAGTQYTSAGDPLPEASVRGGIQYVLSKGFPASKIICGLPFYGRHNSVYDSALFWSQARDTWAANVAYYDGQIDANSMEVLINTYWMTTPECMRRKMDALLKPNTSALLTAHAIIRGIGCWQIGHEDVSHPDLSEAFASWLTAYKSSTLLTREAAAGGGTQARLNFTALPGGNYQVQYTSSLTTPITWTAMAGTFTANAQGQFQVIDPPPLPGQRFYRAVIP